MWEWLLSAWKALRPYGDTHCTTSDDKWAIVSIAINDSKWHSGEGGLSIHCTILRGHWGTSAVAWGVTIHLQITDHCTQPPHKVAHYDLLQKRVAVTGQYVCAHANLTNCTLQPRGSDTGNFGQRELLWRGECFTHVLCSSSQRNVFMGKQANWFMFTSTRLVANILC